MKLKFFSEGGQALILMTLAAIGLLAITGLAVDGSMKFSDRRHAQNAADTAALAGALAKLNGVPQWNLVALDRAADNGYDDSINEVKVYNPPTTGVYSDCNDVHFDCNDYVQVVIDSTLETSFARILGINQLHNHVESVAIAISKQNNFNFGGNAIVALKPTDCAFTVQGNSNVAINGGGVFSNSDASCSFKEQSSCNTTFDITVGGNQGDITMVGSDSIGGCLPNANPVPGGAKQYLFPPPYQEIAAPAACSTAGTQTNIDSSHTELTPGYFATIPLGGHKKNVYLDPGVYCVGSSVSTSGLDSFTVTPPATFGDANGVFIYIKPGGSFQFNAGTVVQLWAQTSGSYANFLIYAAPDYSLSTLPTCNINGAANYEYKGTIYAPYCSVTINGTSDTANFESQVVGYEVNIAGGANVVLNYNGTDNATWDYPEQVGLTK